MKLKILIMSLILLLSFQFSTTSFAYTVQKGDTIIKIASKHNLSIADLAKLNPQIKDLNKIYAGDTLIMEEPKRTSLEEKITTTLSSDYEIYVGQTIDTYEPSMVVSTELVSTETVVTKAAEGDNSEEVPEGFIKVKPAATQIAAQTIGFTDAEIDLLARLVRAEAQIEPFDGKVAVACVVLNRIESSQFPDTMESVIYEPRQFQPVSNGEINKPADEESIAAVKAALTHQRDLVGDSIFFYNPTIATSRWLDTRPTTVTIGQHVFKK
jgi:N-acetylmuramoyl-L-alanine amidase